MSSNEVLNSSETENACVVCFKNAEIFSIGVCDHPVCFECSTRMRVLCKQNECPICRQDMPKVIFTKYIEPYNVLKPKMDRSNLQDRKFGLYFCTPSIQRAYYRLLEHNCTVCTDNSRRWPFKNFQQLKDHMRREHELFYCDLCVENLKIFTFERRCYTRSELAQHRRKGDPDNKSHRGHPLCEFCDVRYVDSDELFRHLRRDHLFCHFCDADGKHQYYNSYDDLKAHFLEEHYLCQEGECRYVQFTHAFRTDIDYKAHMASQHSKHLRGTAHKQARMLDIEFTLAPRRPPQDRGNRLTYAPDRAPTNEGAIGYDNYYMEPGGSAGNNRNSTFVNPLRSEDFPTLGNAESQAPAPTNVTFTSKFSAKPFSGEDFPSLGGGPGPSQPPGVTITSKVNAYRKNEDFPSLGGGSSTSRGPDVTITRTVRGQSGLERNKQNFPALGDNSASSSTVRLSVNSSSNQERGSKVPNVSIHVNNSNGAITTRIRSEPSATVHIRPKTSEDFPALSKGPAPSEPQWITTKSKKQVESKTARVAPAPMLPPSDLMMDFPALLRPSKGGEPKGKKSSSVEVPMTNSWVNLNSYNSETKTSRDLDREMFFGGEGGSRKDQSKLKVEKGKNGGKGAKNSNKKSENKSADINDNNSKAVPLVETSDYSKTKNKKKKSKSATTTSNNNYGSSNNVNTNSENVNNNIVSDLVGGESRLNWEELLDGEREQKEAQRSPKNGIVKKRSELNIEFENLNVRDPEPIRQEDFPALGQSKPPPGFTLKPPPGLVKPPPGINAFNSLLNNKKSNSANIVLSTPVEENGLTFTSSSGQSYSIMPQTAARYQPPANFQSRNVNLIEQFIAAVKNQEAVNEFKCYSDLFKNGAYPAQKYYEHCKSVMGDSFDKLFPELLVLLPDIEKQQELYKLHSAQGMKKGLDVCATCKQVILSRDLRQHWNTHMLENHFPVLGQPTEVNNVWKK